MHDRTRLAALGPGRICTLSNSHSGEQTGLISYRMENDPAVRSYSLNREAILQRVPLLHSKCNFGGMRPWFACPHCVAHVAVIYLGRGGFYCRKCARVGYNSQSEDHIGRAWRQQQEAESKLGEHWQRPKGMHKATREGRLPH